MTEKRTISTALALSASAIATITSLAYVTRGGAETSRQDEDSDFGLILVESTNRPARSGWMPAGVRLASLEETRGNLIPKRNRFTTLHGNTRNAGEISIAFASVLEESFTVEGRAFVVEGPTLLSDGTILLTPAAFSPAKDSTTDFLVVALDTNDGSRIWEVGPGQLGQGGAPLVLHDPEAGREIVYAGGYESVVAIDGETGAVIWETPTGLSSIDPETNRELTSSDVRTFGINCHAPTDTVVIEFASGVLQSYDRRTGILLGQVDLQVEFNVAPSIPVPVPRMATELLELANDIVAESFDASGANASAKNLLGSLLGNSAIVASYFSIDPDQGSIYLTSTLEDGHLGDLHPGDGFSESGALYRFDLRRSDDTATFEFVCRAPFAGTSASTPTISPDGERIYTADNRHNVLSFDRECNRVYAVNAGDQVFGSLAFSSTGHEIYASNSTGVFKLMENVSRTGAKVVFNANLAGAFRPIDEFEVGKRFVDLVKTRLGVEAELIASSQNLATIGENGLMVQSALCVSIPDLPLCAPLVLAITLVDRETGEPINSTPAREETVSVISPGPDGALVVGNSPVRRLITLALIEQVRESVEDAEEVVAFLDDMKASISPPLTGGVTKYVVSRRFDLLARDASCAAAVRLENTVDFFPTAPKVAVLADKQDVSGLVRQADSALKEAARNGDLPPGNVGMLRYMLEEATFALRANQLFVAYNDLFAVCDAL